MKKDTYFLNKADEPASGEHYHLYIKWNYDGDHKYIIRETSVSGDVTTYGYDTGEGSVSEIGTAWTNRAAGTYTNFCRLEHADLVS